MASSKPTLEQCRNYNEKWDNITSAITLKEFYNSFPADGSVSPTDMFNEILQNDIKTLPVGIWCLVKTPRDQYRVVTLHSIRRASAIILGKKGQLTGKVAAIQNDMHTSRSMTIHVLLEEEEMFMSKTNVLVPKEKAVSVEYARCSQVPAMEEVRSS